MKYIFFIFLCLFLMASQTFAANKIVVIPCNQDVTALSNQFIEHDWIKTPMPWYASWAQYKAGGYLFSGGIGTIADKYPDDVDPHLRFINPIVVYDEEQGEIIMCRYHIGNPELQDIDNILEMRAFTYLPENACRVTSSDTVTCREDDEVTIDYSYAVTQNV